MEILSLDQYSVDIGISICELKGTSRIHKIALAREVYWYYLHKKNIKLIDIALMFDRKYPTVINGIRTVTNMIQTKNQSIDNYLVALNIFSHQEISK